MNGDTNNFVGVLTPIMSISSGAGVTSGVGINVSTPMASLHISTLNALGGQNVLLLVSTAEVPNQSEKIFEVTRTSVNIGVPVSLVGNFKMDAGSMSINPGIGASLAIGSNTAANPVPGAMANYAIFFSSFMDTTGATEMFVEDSAGNVTQLSAHAKVDVDMDDDSTLNPLVIEHQNVYSGVSEKINLSSLARLMQDWAHETGKLRADKFVIKQSTFAPKETWDAKELRLCNETDTLRSDWLAKRALWEASLPTKTAVLQLWIDRRRAWESIEEKDRPEWQYGERPNIDWMYGNIPEQRNVQPKPERVKRIEQMLLKSK